MLPEDDYRHGLQATIEGLRYWVPSVSDLARIDERQHDAHWHLQVRPHIAGACTWELVLRDRPRFDTTFAAQSYTERPVTQLSLFLALAQAVVDGRVVERRWVSTQTGSIRAVETLVHLPSGETWHSGGPDAAATPLFGCESHDRHFLPYRR